MRASLAASLVSAVVLYSACSLTIDPDSVKPPRTPRIVAFTAVPSTVAPNGSATLAWKVEDADTVSIEPGLDASAAASVIVTPATSTTYTLVATNSAGSVRSQVRVRTCGFVPFVEYPTGESPSSIVAGDFNRDGIVDFVVANSTSDSVRAYLGNGDATFRATADSPTGDSPKYLAAADFNRDGILDVATADFYGHTVSILCGNGDGTFSAKAALPAGDFPDAVATGDFNADGKEDIAVAPWNLQSVAVFLGNGDGTFQGRADYPSGASPHELAVADLNGDGKVDIVVAPGWSAGVDVLFGRGDGTFLPAVQHATDGAFPFSVKVADISSDSIPDLVLLNFYGGLGVYINTGGGEFGSLLTRVSADVNAPSYLATGDLDSDGNVDVFIPNSGSTSIGALLGNGDGTFRPMLNSITINAPNFAVVCDLNRDQTPDVVVTSAMDNVRVLLGRCPP